MVVGVVVERVARWLPVAVRLGIAERVQECQGSVIAQMVQSSGAVSCSLEIWLEVSDIIHGRDVQ